MPILINVPKGEIYDEASNEFFEIPEDVSLLMEHNLIAVSRWEMKYHKPYLTEKPKSKEETTYYLQCMTITKCVDPKIFNCIPNDELLRIKDYISDPMSGTTINQVNTGSANREVLSSELIYYYMFKLGIPKECENWHLNRLTKLLEVFGVKDGDKKKLSRSEQMARNSAINARNKARYHTKG